MTELQQFQRFIGQTIEKNGHGLSVTQCVDAFRRYQHELNSLRQALDAAGRENSKPLDADTLIARVTERLAAEGITE